MKTTYRACLALTVVLGVEEVVFIVIHTYVCFVNFVPESVGFSGTNFLNKRSPPLVIQMHQRGSLSKAGIIWAVPEGTGKPGGPEERKDFFEDICFD